MCLTSTMMDSRQSSGVYTSMYINKLACMCHISVQRQCGEDVDHEVQCLDAKTAQIAERFNGDIQRRATTVDHYDAKEEAAESIKVHVSIRGPAYS